MAKSKTKANATVPQKHFHSRVSYLFQAATYLTNAPKTNTKLAGRDKSAITDGQTVLKDQSANPRPKQVKHLMSHIRGITRKGIIRVQPDVKRAICKRCDAILIPGQTSTLTVENASNGSLKPWADVFVVRCNECQTPKRFPVGKDRGHGKVRLHANQEIKHGPTLIPDEMMP